MAKCGDCIHADICKEVNGGWFSPENIAYCKGFKDRINYAEVVRCKDCKNLEITGCYGECRKLVRIVKPWDFCSYGERREGE